MYCPVLPSVVCGHVPYNRLWLQPKNRLGTSNVLCTRVFRSLVISIYVIVMGTIKCEKVFGGIFIFSSLFQIKIKILFFLIENKLEKLKITAITFSQA